MIPHSLTSVPFLLEAAAVAGFVASIATYQPGPAIIALATLLILPAACTARRYTAT